MSRELQERADKLMKELIDLLIPIKEEIALLRNSPEYKNIRTLK